MYAEAGEEPESSPAEPDAAKAKFGIAVQDLSPAMARRLGLEGTAGVLVSRVEDSSLPGEVGMLAGDVIVEVNRRPVSNVGDMVRILAELKTGSDVVFLAKRVFAGRSGALYLSGTLG